MARLNYWIWNESEVNKHDDQNGTESYNRSGGGIVKSWYTVRVCWLIGLRTRFICKENESEYWCHVVVSQSDHSYSSVLHSRPHSKYRTFDTYSSGWCWLLYHIKNGKKYGLFVSNLCLFAILCLRFIDLIWNIVFTWIWLVWLFMWLQIWEGATSLNLHTHCSAGGVWGQ